MEGHTGVRRNQACTAHWSDFACCRSFFYFTHLCLKKWSPDRCFWPGDSVGSMENDSSKEDDCDVPLWIRTTTSTAKINAVLLSTPSSRAGEKPFQVAFGKDDSRPWTNIPRTKAIIWFESDWMRCNLLGINLWRWRGDFVMWTTLNKASSWLPFIKKNSMTYN